VYGIRLIARAVDREKGQEAANDVGTN
jgi:hypothetical protein